jgi:hypothetical protein
MSHLDKALRRQALLAAGIFAVVASVVAYQRLHEIAALPATDAAITRTAAEPDLDLPTVVVTARRDPAIREATDDRETASARHLAARSALR